MSKKRKLLYWLFKFTSVVISCAFPVWAVCNKFPLLTEGGAKTTLGIGGVLAIVIVSSISRKTIFSFFKEKLNLVNAPPLVGWMVLLGMAYGFQYLTSFVAELITIFWMGFIGCCIGVALTFIAENIIRKDKDNE
jgi:hypothetical protein